MAPSTWSGSQVVVVTFNV